ncbi:hypothetical protein LBMAG49_11290 [Planctomycetota bacterium]|nr:hypothetical protein LBMAG49_11290 [Planctomycetota bacterium]
MMNLDAPKEPPTNNDFLAAAQHKKQRGLISEFIGFMAENKLWWMTPILLVLLAVGVLLVLGGTGVLPFVYILF